MARLLWTGMALLCFDCLPVGAGELKTETVTVEAPFDMPAMSIPDFSECPRFSILDFGARHDDQHATSEAIGRAIDQANREGGGVVVIPAGEWRTGKIHLKSRVNLHLEKDARLVFSSSPDDYLPAVKTTWEGMECYNYSPLVYAYECQDIAITGEGKLVANLDVWKEWYRRPIAAHGSAETVVPYGREGDCR